MTQRTRFEIPSRQPAGKYKGKHGTSMGLKSATELPIEFEVEKSSLVLAFGRNRSYENVTKAGFGARTAFGGGETLDE